MAWKLVIGQNHLQKPLVFPPGKFTGWWIWWCRFYGILMWLYIGGSPSLLLSLVDCWLSPILWQHNLFGGGGFDVDLLISAAFDSFLVNQWPFLKWSSCFYSSSILTYIGSRISRMKIWMIFAIHAWQNEALQ